MSIFIGLIIFILCIVLFYFVVDYGFIILYAIFHALAWICAFILEHKLLSALFLIFLVLLVILLR